MPLQPVAVIDSFKTISIQPNDETIVADGSTDTLTLVAGSGIDIGINSTTDEITITNTGAPGVPGDSAYDVAVTNGFVGDEAAWLSSLIGANGADGVPGATGPLNTGVGVVSVVRAQRSAGGLANDPSYWSFTTVSGSVSAEFLEGSTVGLSTDGHILFTLTGFTSAPAVIYKLNNNTIANGGVGNAAAATLTSIDLVASTQSTSFAGILEPGNPNYITLFNPSVHKVYYTPLLNSAVDLYFQFQSNGGITGATGATGATGSAGAAGDPGPSAYDVAVTNGFVGDEAAWLASLVGSTGSAGANGNDGTPGVGVPTGGAAGQVLAKIDTDDYNTEWVNASTADTGNVTFTGSTINTSDSSDISVSKAIIPTDDNLYDLGSPSLRFRHLYVGPGTIYIGDQTRAITATANSIDLPSGTTIGGEEPLKTTIQNIFNDIITNYLVYNDIVGAPTDISDLNDSSNSLVSGIVQITGVTYPVGQSFVLITGGETLTLTGVGFKTLCNVYLNGAPVASTTFVSETSVTFVTPVVSTAGTYQLTLINQDGTSANWSSGIIFVTLASPKFTDPSGLLETFSRNYSHNTTLDVVGGTSPYTFAITAGALPSGLTLNTSTGVISGTTPNVSSDTVYNFIATVTDSAAASSSSAFQIAVVIPVPYDVGLPTFNIVSNRVFFIEYEEDLTNTPALELPTFNIVSNNTFFIEYEEDLTNTPELELPAFNMISNNAFFIEYEEDITNTPTIDLPAFSITSYTP